MRTFNLLVAYIGEQTMIFTPQDAKYPIITVDGISTLTADTRRELNERYGCDPAYSILYSRPGMLALARVNKQQRDELTAHGSWAPMNTMLKAQDQLHVQNLLKRLS